MKPELNIDREPTTTVGREQGNHSRQIARVGLVIRLVISDAVSVLIGFSLARLARGTDWLSLEGVSLTYLVMPLLLLFALNAGAYAFDKLADYAEMSRRIVVAVVQTLMALFTLLFLVQGGEEISRLGIALAFFSTLTFALLFRYFADRFIRKELKDRILDELVLVDGVQLPPMNFQYLVDVRENDLEPDLNDPAMLERFAKATSYYDRVVVACTPERQAIWSIVLKTVNCKGELLVGARDDLGVLGLDTFRGLNTLVVARGNLSTWDRAMKRIFDVCVSLAALVALAPLMLVVAILIKLDSRGPVFFRQPRVGQNNVPFQIFKFRSMRQEKSDVAGDQSTRRDDDRISRFGGFIRKTSIDELPQLFNVLLGEMSIVGPRPHALGSRAEDQLFWQINQRYWERHVLKPGITGLAQVRGYRGSTEKLSDLTNRLNSDLEYLSGWNLWRDFAILAATFKVLVHPNAY